MDLRTFAARALAAGLAGCATFTSDVGMDEVLVHTAASNPGMRVGRAVPQLGVQTQQGSVARGDNSFRATRNRL